MQRILVAPTAFKGTMSPLTVANAIAQGILNTSKGIGAKVELVILPLADGGDGTVESVAFVTGCRTRTTRLVGLNGQTIDAPWLDMGDAALVELASTCGIAQLQGADLQPMTANTENLGLIIKQVLQEGFRKIWVAAGGSASTDAGAGALHALGAQFFDVSGSQLPMMNGQSLGLVEGCDLTDLLAITQNCDIRVLTDVINPLYGSNGAAHVFSPQKGANREQVNVLDAGLRHFAGVLEQAAGSSLSQMPGSGSAGGTAFGLASALGAKIEPGFQWVSSVCKLPERLAECQLVISGEGKLDSQSLQGKVIGELIRLCKAHSTPFWVVAALTDLDSHSTQELAGIITPKNCQAMMRPMDLTNTVQTDVQFTQLFHNWTLESSL